MYKKILVPLDGSELAECALPHAEEIASKCGADIILVSVTERVQGYRPVEEYSNSLGIKLVPEAAGKLEKQGQKYLDRVAKGLESKGIKVQTEMLMGNPAEELTIYTKTENCDLVIMASHGRSGPSRWAHGSVAEKVFLSSYIPILMVRAPGCTPDS
jgi:nucleotide-binding universal stress UspA family protein